MRHESYDETCAFCRANAGEVPEAGPTLWEDDLWMVRHAAEPYPVAGWVKLFTRRHVRSPSRFTDDEAAALGPTVRRLQQVLEDVTGVPLVYMAAMGESTPHFHAHLVPRYEEQPPGTALPWGLFALMGRAAAGEVHVPREDVERVSAEFTRRLAQT